MKRSTIQLVENGTHKNNIHELYLTKPVQIDDQDFIGILQPDFESSRLVVFYQKTSGPQNFLLTEGDTEYQRSIVAVSSFKNSSENDYPLLSVSVG